ncbi:hypothetical protein V2J09_007010 [Rumex salicifolius]
MLGEFISKALVMILGYAYPALECFKTLEKNKVDMNDLRFWCQYWIIVALLSVCERFGDIFISWVPLYEELKLAFIIYLWYPKTKGTSYVYETLLRPLVSKHETDIERHLNNLRIRSWDLALYYWQNCTELGQGAYFQVLEYMLKGGNVSGKEVSKKKTKDRRGKGDSPPPPPPPMPMEYFPSSARGGVSYVPPSSPRGFFSRLRPQPSAPPMPQSTMYRSVAQSPKAETVQLDPDEAHTEYIHVEEWAESVPNGSPKPKSTLGHLRLRKNKP